MSALPTWKGKKRRAGSKKGKKGQKGKKRRKTTKSSTRRKPSYEDGETAPFWSKELEEVYAQLPMPAMAQGASTAADLASGCSSHDGRKWSTWCSRRIVENKSLEPGVRARAHWREHVAFPKDVTVVSAETIAEAKIPLVLKLKTSSRTEADALTSSCLFHSLTKPRGLPLPSPHFLDQPYHLPCRS